MRTAFLINMALVTCIMISGCSMNQPGYPQLDSGFWQFYSEDPSVSMDDVWVQADGTWICKGRPLGYIYSDCTFTDFVLELEWKWPEDQPGKGGVLFRMTGDHKVWPKSLEAQINAENAGDFWGLDGYSFTGPADRLSSLDHEKFGKLTNLKKTEMLEKDPGQWNTYKIIVKGGTVTLIINGKEINKASECDIEPGYICLTSEGSEIHFRNVRLTSLD